MLIGDFITAAARVLSADTLEVRGHPVPAAGAGVYGLISAVWGGAGAAEHGVLDALACSWCRGVSSGAPCEERSRWGRSTPLC